ncbi:hypothetical protein [Streptomyces sp. NPDC046939]|uniref:hypothetical protein n=1 Tax=Streptomyces sp. NPDC046939 TaxID=3155376 RepID=UPI0033E8167B
MKTDPFSRLAELDAAPRAELSPAELDRKEQLLAAVLSDTGRPDHAAATTGFRRPLVRRLAYTTAGGLAAGAALVAVTLSAQPSAPGGSGPLSSAEVATWTSTAHRPKQSDVAFSHCFEKAMDVNAGSGRPGAISNWDRRGTTVSMIVTSNYRSAYCLAGSQGPGMAVPITSKAQDTVSANDITLDAQGALGKGSARFRYAVGLAGQDVKEITVRDQGRTVHATVEQMTTSSLPWSRWTAWWPESEAHDQMTGTLTLTLKDGTKRTINGASLPK